MKIMEEYYIIYPRGDKSRIQILDFEGREHYELSDWSLASRKRFSDREEAVTYARELAHSNNIIFNNIDDDGNSYLD